MQLTERQIEIAKSAGINPSVLNRFVESVRKRAIHEAMACARGIVRSYGPNTVPEQDREALCRTMDHYEQTAR